ncbi:hypothetical protein D3C87_2121750 [compost metagenome]
MTALISSYSASVISTKGFFSTLPTVLTAMSMLPSAALASAKSFSTLAALVRSPEKAWAAAPVALIAATVSSAAAFVAALL